MQNSEEIKNSVKEKYGAIAKSAASGCCGDSCGCASESEIGVTIMKDEYHGLPGYNEDADLGLGCGLPTEYAGIKPGDTVIDLGSGAGNDVFVARSITGESGRVIGLDFTPEMIAKANKNNERRAYKNIEFVLGEIENIPLADETADVIVSNCVLNLVPDKKKAFAEMYRILKKGGHFCVSDIVLNGEMSAELQESAALYAGCISGALQQDAYIKGIIDSGFVNVEIKKSKPIVLPDELLATYLSTQAIEDYHKNVKGIFSITVTGYRPA